MRRRSPRWEVRRSAAFSQWPLDKGHAKGALECMGYAVRTQGYLLIQWTGSKQCEAHYDLFRQPRNDSHDGRLREVRIRAPHIERRMRRKLMRVMALELATLGHTDQVSPEALARTEAD
uniref:Uncharacterized protein n=1 Tax=Haptolina brevifila TaxID=156173 RepID=A0A7S2MHJ7_9EUKA|mmetsp:Transcript_52445/g.104222  ORF Transcript_52445/g.104222 Transcript_52445/m.104222 type:complete len:119 (+) Transcript_52445:109-465(+)